MAEPRRIRVTIDRLVLQGVPAGDRALVARSLERSLSAALEARGLPAGSGLNTPSLSLRVPGAGGAGALGAAAGRSVHAALTRALGGGTRR